MKTKNAKARFSMPLSQWEAGFLHNTGIGHKPVSKAIYLGLNEKIVTVELNPNEKQIKVGEQYSIRLNGKWYETYGDFLTLT